MANRWTRRLYCEVMFDKHISGEVPEHRDFIYTKGIPALERMGVNVTVLRSEKTYVDLFTGRITCGPKKGMLRSFPIRGRCAVQRDCKLKPIRQYQKSLPSDTIQYIGHCQRRTGAPPAAGEKPGISLRTCLKNVNMPNRRVFCPGSFRCF